MGVYIWKNYNARQPTSNTIAYFEFESDKSDSISGGPILSSSNATVENVDGVNCLNLGGNTQYIDRDFSKANTPSGIVWFRGCNGCVLGSYFYNASNAIAISRYFLVEANYDMTYKRYTYGTGYGWQSIGGGWYFGDDKRHCIGFVEGSSGGKIYIDGEAVRSNPTVEDGFASNMSSIGVGCCYYVKVDRGQTTISYTDTCTTGYIGRIALFNTEISYNDYLDFYNGTKFYYK